jgi:hypothetical protein
MALPLEQADAHTTCRQQGGDGQAADAATYHQNVVIHLLKEVAESGERL